MKKALITGITGQDGSYLAEFLLEKGYEVHGIVRRASISNTARIDHLIEKNAITLHDGDLSDSSGLIRLVGEIKPDEIYNLAAQSHVQVSFDAPEYSGDVDALGVLRVLEAVRVCGLTKTCKVYQASTSELYGKVEEVPQRETTPFHPYSPYAVAKQYGFCMELGSGEKLTCCGDEPYNECEKQYAEHSTWLLHEAFCLHGQADLFHPYEKHHSTVKDAAELAESLGVKNLLLYHTEDKNIARRKELYTAEGRQYFHGNLFVPEDLEVIEL